MFLAGPSTPTQGGGGSSDLTLSSATFSDVASPGTDIGTFANRRANTSMTLIPDDGRFLPSSDGSKLVVGLVKADAGTVPILCIEKPLDGVGDSRTTTLLLTVTGQALTPFAPMSASQAPGGLYGFRRINPAYAGACCIIRDSTATDRTINFTSDGLGLDTSLLYVRRWRHVLNAALVRPVAIGA